MAKAKSSILTGVVYGFGRDTRIEKIKTEMGICFKEVGDHIVISKKVTRMPKFSPKQKYVRDFFCYADLMYRRMTRTQRKKWIEYYRKVKRSIPMADKRRKEFTYSKFKKKYWGYHNYALWVYLLWYNGMGEFFYDYLKSRIVIDEIELFQGKITVKGFILHEKMIEIWEENLETFIERLKARG